MCRCFINFRFRKSWAITGFQRRLKPGPASMTEANGAAADKDGVTKRLGTGFATERNDRGMGKREGNGKRGV